MHAADSSAGSYPNPFEPILPVVRWTPLVSLSVFALAKLIVPLLLRHVRLVRICFTPFVTQDEADSWLRRKHATPSSADGKRARRQQGRKIALAVTTAVFQGAAHLARTAHTLGEATFSRQDAAKPFVWLVLAGWLAASWPATAPIGLITQGGILLLASWVQALSEVPAIAGAGALHAISIAVDILLSMVFFCILVAMPVAPGGHLGQVSAEERARVRQARHDPPPEHEDMVENYKLAPTSPEDYISFFSSVTYTWMSDIQNLACQRSLRPTDVWKMRSLNDTGLLHAKFATLQGPLLPRLLRLSAHDATLDALWKILGVTMTYAAPALSKRILESIEEAPDAGRAEHGWTPRRQAFALAVCALVITTLRFVAELINYHRARQVGLRIRTVLTVELFAKVLRRRKDVSPAGGSSTRADVGIVVNMMATDINNLLRIGCDLHNLYGAPIEIVIATLFLWSLLGPAALAGIAVLVLAIPANYALGRKNARLQKAWSEARDARIALTAELVSTIRFCKAQGLQHYWRGRIDAARATELRRLASCRINNLIISVFWTAAPLVVTLTSFYVYAVVQGQQLTVPVAFTALTLFAMLRGPLDALPNFLMMGFQGAVSVKRLEAFLSGQEIDAIQESPSAQVQDAVFVWPSAPVDSTFSLRVDARLPEAGVCLIEGATASGKSALLLSVANEMERRQGTLSRPGSVSLAGQQVWLEGGRSIRDNILFGEEFDAARYAEATRSCQLLDDLAALPEADLTRVSTSTLSGGQKARIALCRALYARSTLVLLDDPLAAVDARVQQRLIDDAIFGPLSQGRLLMLATHHPERVRPRAAAIFTVEGGRAIISAKQESLLPTEPQNSHQQLANPPSLQQDHTESARVGARLYTAEHRRRGKASLSALRLFLDASRYQTWVAYFAMRGMMQFSVVAESFWLRAWGEQKYGPSAGFYLKIYAGILGSIILMRFLQSVCWYAAAQRAGKLLHTELLSAVLRAKPRWYDTTPTGVILNRFMSDVWTLDNDLPNNFGDLLQNLIIIIPSVAVIVAFLPAFLAPLLVLVIIGPRWTAGYIASTRDLQRIESVMASPIYSRFDEVMRGIDVVRAHSQQDRLKQEMVDLTNAYMAQWWAICSIEVWLSVRIGILGGISVFVVTILCLSGVIDVGDAGIAIATAATIPQRLYALLHNQQQLINNTNSLERIAEFLHLSSEIDGGNPLEQPWPTTGHIVFRAVSARYAPELPIVLSGIDLEIGSGQRIAVVGRTGSGKSSLVGVLLRLLDAEGDVRIDGVSIQNVPLEILRRQIVCCPQNPVLFSGTVRSNLDPFGEMSDAEMIRSLAGLSTELADGLDLNDEVASGGSNLSAGQRQVISLARALLLRPKILLLDEATSDTDVILDGAIQATLAQLSACTVITVAHRLRTIMHYDVVIVMEQGQIVERGSPSALFSDNASRFHEFCKSAGEEELHMLAALLGPSAGHHARV